MQNFKHDILAFRTNEEARVAHAAQTAALHLLCGIDLVQALEANPRDLAGIAAKVRRVLERERLKGARRHWSYDLNRHIALKQALDRLRRLQGEVGTTVAPGKQRAKTPFRLKELEIKPPSACVPGPSSWPAENERPRSSAPPSDTTGRGPTSRDTGPESARNGSSDAASGS